MQARIYRPAKSAMTSGYGNSRRWVLEFADSGARGRDPLMGWAGGGSMNSQVRMRFDSKEDAIAYAERNGLAYVVEEEKRRRTNIRPRGYGGNFAHDRRGAWTH